MKKVCCQLSPFSHTQERWDPYTNLVRLKNRIRSRHGKRKNQDSLWKTKRENSRWSQNWDPEERISSQVWKKKWPGIIWNYWYRAKGNWSYYHRVWAIQARSIATSRTTIRTKSGSSWSSYQKSSRDGKIEESSRVTSRWMFREQDWSKIKTLLMNSRQEFRNYRMKLLLWIIREILKMLNQYAVDYPTLPANQRYSHFFRDPGGMLCCPGWMLSRNDKPPDICDTHGISGNVFLNPPASSSSLYPGGCNPWISHVTEDGSEIPVRTVSQKFIRP